MRREYKITDKHRAMFAEMLREGADPVSVLCDVLSDEKAPEERRRQAAKELLPYYHAKLAKIGPLLKRFARWIAAVGDDAGGVGGVEPTVSTPAPTPSTMGPGVITICKLMR